ncbi:recombinase family protein [Lachnobacterium bovis]|uniref:Resolvase, N terminal domain n=2 Tax=Lachnobacterium bovis TaxID=140626 RepID=A0A1H9USV7_9FIRM|nr:recombinase family protein [Lachnobacterium bovis]SES12610.1 Resolvase, N terminal domain [Lachnobacterium bovis]
MAKEKVKVYLYTRVSTAMQIDGYSLDAQKSRMKAFCEFNDYEIAGEYEEAGRLMISVLSAVAEIERENIRVQTMEGRMQKVREGRWNGGFAPYGYALIDGKLEINEEEVVAIRTIFDQYVNTDMGSNGIAKYLENLDYEDKHYKRRKADLEDRLSKTYDKIEETENALVEAKAKKRSILAEKVCGDNIYKALIFFDKMYEPMNEAEGK